MNARTWIRRSLVFHRRMHLALAGGAALAAAVLAAAMLTGDALNRNLRRIALERVGGIRSAVELRGRFVSASLADRLAQRTGATVAPVLSLSATLLAADDTGAETRIDRVSAYGVDPRFFTLGQTKPPADSGLLLSRRVADALGPAVLAPALALRFEQPSAFPVEMPLGDRRGDRAVRRSVQSQGVLPDAALGRFSLRANQLPPLNVFADREWLATEAGVAGRANLLLSDAEPAALEAALTAGLEAADLGLGVAPVSSNGVWLVQSPRVYLDEAYTRALSGTSAAAVFALHHLVDGFSAGDGALARETPYGFVTAASPSADPRLGVVPAGMADDEVVINAWLAETLGLAPGDTLRVTWRRFEAGGRLTPDSAAFRVARIVTMDDARAEKALLPVFPGLSDADRCADWDIGMPMDREKLKDTGNEAYWKAYGPTPKAFFTLQAGRRMLGTHFGSAMTARLAPETDREAILALLRRADPRELGLSVLPARQEALQAAEQAMDFRELFVGMAFVLMASALILTGLLASLGVAHRREEVGVLRAAGFGPRRIIALWLAESLPPLVAGSMVGVAIGVGGARLLVWALNHFWTRAIASVQVPFAVGAEACVWSGVLALGLSLLAVALGVRRSVRAQVRDLLGGEIVADGVVDGGRRRVGWPVGVGLVSALGAAAMLASSGRASSADAAGIFFGAGVLLMVGLLCAALLATHALSLASHRRPASGPVRAGLLNVGRHRGRSLLVMVLLAAGCFLTVGILAMKQDPAADTLRPGSGGGGFASMVELSLPLPGDQGGNAIRAALGAEASVLSLRVRDGDEAGCLNLNRALQPRLLGVSPEAAAALRAFDKADSGVSSAWAALRQPLADGAIPALAGDLTTVQYGLHGKIGVMDGSVYEYRGEDGRVWRLRLVGALPVRTGILQGSLLIDEAAFTRIFPSAPGYGMWLVRSSLPDPETTDRLRRALGRNGGIVTPVRDRLRLLGAVEATYLDMFLVLGGLGVVLGAAGVGLVVLRNAAARRGELAVLRAIGIPTRSVLSYLLVEYGAVLLAGLLAGAVPALVAVQPAMRGLGQEMPVGTMVALMAAMVASGLLGTVAAVLAASRMRLMEALRGE